MWEGSKGSCAVCVDLQAVETLEFFGELYSLAKGFGPFLRGFGQALEKGRVLFLVTTSTSPSLQAYAELHALFSYTPLVALVGSTWRPISKHLTAKNGWVAMWLWLTICVVGLKYLRGRGPVVWAIMDASWVVPRRVCG